MSFSTKDLRSAISAGGGPIHTNRWDITLPSISGANPGGGTTEGGGNNKAVQRLCTAVRLPGKSLTTLDRQIGLEPIKVGSGYTYAPVSMTFYLTNDYSARQYWQAWMDMIVNPRPPYSAGFHSEYAQPITIKQLDKENKPKYEIKLLKAYPTDIAEIEFNNQAVSAIGEVTVTVGFSHYEATKL